MIEASVVNFFACYRFNRKWLLIEMGLNISSQNIDWCSIVVPDESLKPMYWQTPWLEQYLNEDGTKKICKPFDVPKEAVTPCRIAFFIYKEGSEVLRTPYGEFDLCPPKRTPWRLRKIIKFMKPD